MAARTCNCVCVYVCSCVYVLRVCMCVRLCACAHVWHLCSGSGKPLEADMNDGGGIHELCAYMSCVHVHILCVHVRVCLYGHVLARESWFRIRWRSAV
jgi:hypothetical protein